jgi:holo-[acyl-carrier protein] synthase
VIGLGTDLVDIDRFRRTLARTPTLVHKLFTEGERAYADAAGDPAERYAARFAAKEAVMKALGVGLGAFDWHDVEVVRASSGAPTLRITGRAAVLADEAGVRAWSISISHTGAVAQAVVVAQ